MKLFQASQKYLAIIGVRPLLPDEKSPFNRRNLQVFIFVGWSMTAAIAFLFIDAQTLQEYAECLFALFTLIGIFVGFSLVIIKTKETFQLINNLEILIENSK